MDEGRFFVSAQATGFAVDVPVGGSVHPWPLILSLAATISNFRFKAGMIPRLLACPAAGVLLHVTAVA